MNFSSASFFVFFPITLAAYWALPRACKVPFMMLASLFFYMTWSAKLVSLLLLSATLDYYLARGISTSEDPSRRKLLLVASVVFNLAFLGIFKYANFFLDTVGKGVYLLGLHFSIPHLDIILPIGISFYTFESMSYTIDIYHRNVAPAGSLIDYLLFVAYFPHQIAGPILRARDFLPQIENLPAFSSKKFIEGLNLFLFGLVKKVFIANRLAMFADTVFGNPRGFDGLSTWLAVIGYAGQIYCDFSGYSDMARGIGKTFGFEIMVNFRTPYLSENISEFWQRWHISLSTWLRDYLFTPLGGYRGTRLRGYRNLFLTMFLGGLWHGASWTFVLWGAYHGALLILRRVYLQAFGRSHSGASSGSLGIFKAILSRGQVFVLVCIGWVFFRAQNFGDAAHILRKLCFLGTGGSQSLSKYTCFLIALTLSFDLVAYHFEKRKIGFMAVAERSPALLNSLVYASAILLLLIFSPHQSSPFIYFQF